MELSTVLYILTGVLLSGVLFAWYNVYLEIKNKCSTCNPEGGSIFWSKCFWGAMFFTIAFALSVYSVALL
ncbi:TPA: hypothetical protein DDZ75_01345 [Patescibacteria group bacterium]|nr:hypothetical protein [Patescibacteria group bacterium]